MLCPRAGGVVQCLPAAMRVTLSTTSNPAASLRLPISCLVATWVSGGTGHEGKRVCTQLPCRCCAGAQTGLHLWAQWDWAGSGQVSRLAAALFNKITDAGVVCVITQHQDVVGEDSLVASGAGRPLIRGYFFRHIPQASTLAIFPTSGARAGSRAGHPSSTPGLRATENRASMGPPGDRGWTWALLRVGPGQLLHLTVPQKHVSNHHLPGGFYLMKFPCAVVPRS